jgi:hypothetical protein
MVRPQINHESANGWNDSLLHSLPTYKSNDWVSARYRDTGAAKVNMPVVHRADFAQRRAR